MATEQSDEAKYLRMFDLFYEHVARYCLRRTAVDEVNDVVADVFTVAWRKVASMPDGHDALPWLYGVARNELRNRNRARRRLAALRLKLQGHSNYTQEGPEPLVIRNSDLAHLMEALVGLRAGDREVLLLRTHEELDFSEIAIVLGCTPEAARKRLSRAIGRLRRAAGIPAAEVSRGGPVQSRKEVTSD